MSDRIIAATIRGQIKMLEGKRDSNYTPNGHAKRIISQELDVLKKQLRDLEARQA